MVEKRDFDRVADSWDEQPRRVRLAADVASAIMAAVELRPEMDVLDFGCGTGLLTLRLQPFVRSITGLDTSRGMLEVLQRKVEREGLANVRLFLNDPDGRPPAGPYHLIVSSMTFHHVPEIPPLLSALYSITAPGGLLCIADLDSEGGAFHDNPEGVFHHGFERDEICEALRRAGYAEARTVDAAEVVKPSADGGVRRFKIFLAVGRKNDGKASAPAQRTRHHGLP